MNMRMIPYDDALEFLRAEYDKLVKLEISIRRDEIKNPKSNQAKFKSRIEGLQMRQGEMLILISKFESEFY